MTVHARDKHRGFTLLEVLIALAVIAIALLALGRSSAFQVNSLASLQENTLATWVADNVITDARLKTLDTGRYQGSEAMGQQQWYWELQIQPSPDPGILRMDVVVHSDPDRNSPILSHTGFSRVP